MVEIRIKEFDRRWLIITGVSLSIMIVYFMKVIELQVINGEYYYGLANASTTYVVETAAKRGEIVDKNGESLAINEVSHNIVFDRFYMESGTENDIILKLINIINLKNEKWIDVLPIKLNSDGSFSFEGGKEKEIAVLKKTLKLNNYATAQNCMDQMVKNYKCSEYSLEEQRNICSVRYNMVKTGYESSMTIPYKFAENISQETVAIVLERSHEMRGVDIRESSVRKYVNGSLAPHVVGTIGKLTQEEYEQNKDNYKMDDYIGKSGIEAAMEKYLKGEGGKRRIEKSSSGSVINIAETQNADPGDTIFLTIDSKIQRAADESLERNVKLARANSASDCKSGSAVVLDVRDFSVVAAANYPGYDLQKYFSDTNYYNEIVSDTEYTPLVNRAFNGAFTPGSIYKPVVASAALEEGVIDASSTIYCNGLYSYFADSGFTMRCMGVHGNSSVVYALSKSCNVFFAETGRRLGIELMDLYANRFGLGEKTGVEIYESKGVLAGPEFSKSMGAVWYEGNTSQAAIGQSDNMFTPIQLATYTAAIANGGHRYRTHLVNKITDYTRQDVVLENSKESPELITDVDVSDKNLEIVRNGMRGVVTNGTATDFSGYPIKIAAKTGTAENVGSDHTTFICFAPYDNPEIAISVVIEHGSSGKWSKDVARDILNAYFNVS